MTTWGLPVQQDIDSLCKRIDEVVAAPAEQLLVAFFDARRPFAGSTFDELPDNPRNHFSPSDLVAASLLDVRFRPLAVRALLDGSSNAVWRHLTSIPDDIDIWDATDDVLQSAIPLWNEVRALDGVGPTRTSKLLARKRPRLIPIVDSVIRSALPLGNNSWTALRSALQKREIRESIEAIRPPRLGSSISTLRLLDAATWMRYSQSKNAEMERQAVGLG